MAFAPEVDNIADAIYTAGDVEISHLRYGLLCEQTATLALNSFISAQPVTGRLMDVARQRPSVGRKWIAIATASLFGLLAMVWLASTLGYQTAAAVVDKNSLLIDTVKRGQILHAVLAQGTFVPVRVRVASATQPGVVNEISVRVGQFVTPGVAIAVMQNPALESQATNARAELDVAGAQLADVREQAQATLIEERSGLSDAKAQMLSAALQAASYSQLRRRGLIASVTYQQAAIQAQKSTNDVANAAAQVDVAMSDGQAKIAAARAHVDEARAQVASAEAQIQQLTVRSAAEGVVQSIDVDPGMSVAPNTPLARIADARDLKAVLQVAETDMHSIAVGMPVDVNASGVHVPGQIIRVAPSAQNGTVAVDVGFRQPLPASARLQSTVDANIIAARLNNVISIARPAGASDNSTVDLFKILDNGNVAQRVRVHLGQGSNERIEVLAGLSAGDSVIISDMSAFQNQPEVRLK